MDLRAFVSKVHYTHNKVLYTDNCNKQLIPKTAICSAEECSGAARQCSTVESLWQVQSPLDAINTVQSTTSAVKCIAGQTVEVCIVVHSNA